MAKTRTSGNLSLADFLKEDKKAVESFKVLNWTESVFDFTE